MAEIESRESGSARQEESFLTLKNVSRISCCKGVSLLFTNQTLPLPKIKKKFPERATPTEMP
jgi:hypothetical protein